MFILEYYGDECTGLTGNTPGADLKIPTRRPLYVISILLPDTTKTDYILINIFISFQIQIVRLWFISMTLNYTINTLDAITHYAFQYV